MVNARAVNKRDKKLSLRWQTELTSPYEHIKSTFTCATISHRKLETGRSTTYHRCKKYLHVTGQDKKKKGLRLGLAPLGGITKEEVVSMGGSLPREGGM